MTQKTIVIPCVYIFVVYTLFGFVLILPATTLQTVFEVMAAVLTSIGLIGFAHKKRIWTVRAWQVWFVLMLLDWLVRDIFTGNQYFNLFEAPVAAKLTNFVMALFTKALPLVFMFRYAFKSTDIWFRFQSHYTAS